VWAGGDLFEFRLLDLVWVPLALLAQSGLAGLAAPLPAAPAPLGPARRGAAATAPQLVPGQVRNAAVPFFRRRTAAAVAAAVLLTGAGAWLPALSHRAFPREYVTSFPGGNGRADGSRDLVPASRVPPVARALLGPWIRTYNSLARRLTVSLVGLRQEEHERFAAEVVAAGLDLRDLVQEGVLPADTRIALNCVGAIPFICGLWTLDRIGLCDRHVARMPPQPGRKMAHSKMADANYIRSQRVDLEPVLAYSLFVSDAVVEAESRRPRCLPPEACYVARVGPDLNVLARLPLGLAHAQARMPAVPFELLGQRDPRP